MNTKKLYKLEIVMNGKTFKKNTDDLKVTILDLKPINLATEMYITIVDNKTKGEFNKKLRLVDGRKLFNDEETLDLFINLFTSLYPNERTE